MARNTSKKILIKADKQYNLDLEANRLNQVGKKGPEIIGASVDMSRDLAKKRPSRRYICKFYNWK